MYSVSISGMLRKVSFDTVYYRVYDTCMDIPSHSSVNTSRVREEITVAVGTVFDRFKQHLDTIEKKLVLPAQKEIGDGKS